MLFLFSNIKVMQEVHINCKTAVCQIKITDTNADKENLWNNFNYLFNNNRCPQQNGVQFHISAREAPHSSA